jgi:RNA recognition motif. (a.k.a. RRM, RBD, or RNP domain)
LITLVVDLLALDASATQCYRFFCNAVATSTFCWVILSKPLIVVVMLFLQDGSYSSSDIRAAMARHGDVEDVVIRQGKKKNKGSALVVMCTRAAAAAAASAQNGDLGNPLLVVPFCKVHHWKRITINCC